MLTPVGDANFAMHPVHGAAGQRRLFQAAMVRCTKFRTALDIGAHIGLWTCMLRSWFKEVWAFEPVPENFVCLERNAAAANVVCLNIALGERDGKCDMVMPENGNSGCWRIGAGEDVTVSTLDGALYETLRNVDFVKLDVEGAEGFVLRGGEDLIERYRPVVTFEDNGLGLQYYGAAWADPKLFLAERGYRRAVRLHKDEIWIPN